MCRTKTQSSSTTIRYIYKHNYYIKNNYNIKLPSREGYIPNTKIYIKSNSPLKKSDGSLKR